MTVATKGRLGRWALVLLAALSLGYPLLARLPGLPDCPFGQDPGFNSETVCSRTFGGLWRSIVIGLTAGAASCALALGLALLARRLRGVADETIAKAADLFFAIPDVLVLIAIGFAVNVVNGEGGARIPALLAMIVSLTAVGWAAPTRQIQNRLRSLEALDFVLAAEAVGASRWRIIVRHLLPFARDYVLAIFLLRVPAIILTESTVSFLGFGLPIDEPSLGGFIGTNYDKLMYGGQAQVVLPAWGMLILIVLAFQWTGQDVMRRASEEAS